MDLDGLGRKVAVAAKVNVVEEYHVPSFRASTRWHFGGNQGSRDTTVHW